MHVDVRFLNNTPKRLLSGINRPGESVTIDVLDGILLHVFDHNVAEAPKIEAWHASACVPTMANPCF